MTIKQTITVDSVDFAATLWFDATDNTVDIEAIANVQSQFLYYPGSTLVPALVSVYTVPVNEWESVFASAARKSLAAV